MREPGTLESRDNVSDLTDAQLDAALAHAFTNSEEINDLICRGFVDVDELIKAVDNPPAASDDEGDIAVIITDRPGDLFGDTTGDEAKQVPNQVISEAVDTTPDRAARTLHDVLGLGGDPQPDTPEDPDRDTTEDSGDESRGDFSPARAHVPPPSATEPADLPDWEQANTGPDEGDRAPSATAKALTAARDKWAVTSTKTKIFGGALTAACLILGSLFILNPNGTKQQQPEQAIAGPAATIASAEPDRSGRGITLNDQIDGISAGSGPGTKGCAAPTTDSRLAVSGSTSEAWICGRSGNYDGAILNIRFRNPVSVEKISFTPGYNYVAPTGDDLWDTTRIVTGVLWRLGGKQARHDVIPSRETATITFDQPITTGELSLTIQSSVDPAETAEKKKSVFSDPKSQTKNATAIQNLVITGKVV